MLQFNQKQKDAFDKQARWREARRLAPVMRRNFAEQTKNLDDAQLEQTIAQALDRAAAWSLSKHSACVNFVILWLLLGPDFDKAEKVRRYLNYPIPHVDTSVKLNVLMSEVQYMLGRAADSKVE
jgi:hypothetical protein